jgi:hypothetical protein
MLEDDSSSSKHLQFRLCWHSNSSRAHQEAVVVAKDGQTMYPDVNDNNTTSDGACGGGAPVISWSGDSQPAPLVHVSLLSAEDGKGDIARYSEKSGNT